ncbi:MAG: T9SS type A sorting domain-containing protein, partial [Flavobacteriales bacterium]|nr:T9SS type A sorting domain-containing protein [Flavobacteriales bacterium]
NGEVFFATEKGIVSFLADATNFYEEMTAVNVFPNPVHPSYDGLITIDGLSRDADVKITDVSGNVVFQTEANGGRATWNGLDFNGSRVSTGVYMVFVSTSDGQSTTVSKIAFIH